MQNIKRNKNNGCVQSYKPGLLQRKPISMSRLGLIRARQSRCCALITRLELPASCEQQQLDGQRAKTINKTTAQSLEGDSEIKAFKTIFFNPLNNCVASHAP
ncbi:hypothetical protein OUZ56_004631 [Daphnia magna]|uniref:Uncharacterized protein n=1 Tax=Daphnia magna TaxID=35525 RepID=A0ABQ9YQF8_9CRUS|nr:hypothetical protein OUZ56_004631 [Daphnia magna]